MNNQAIEARDALMDIVSELRSSLPESEMDKFINPLESAIRALGDIITITEE